MRRLRRWRPGESDRDCRSNMICNNGRGLTVKSKIRWHHGVYHRKQAIAVKAEYGSKFSARCDRKYQRPGKILRNKVFHVPKYKYVRGGITEMLFSLAKSTNAAWRSRRIRHIKEQRAVLKLHSEHMDNNLQPHWWRV